MFFRPIRTALRVLRKRPGYAFITVFGLGLGLACFALITLFVLDELSYDRHHEDSDRVYRATFTGYPPNSEPDHFAVVGMPVGRILRDERPEVESLVRIQNYDPVVLHNGEYFSEDRFWFAEPDLFNVFTHPIIAGPQEGQLVRSQTMVISESMARKYFGGEQAVGQSLTLNDSLDFEITGIIADVPQTSHLRADAFVSFATYTDRVPEHDRWLDLGMYTYMKLHETVDGTVFAQDIQKLAHEKIGDDLDQFGFRIDINLEPLTDIYLTSKVSAQAGPIGDMTQVWVFSAVALFVLLLALINFTNLATARSMERSREIGVRKAVGASRGSLIRQFLGESLLSSGLALIIGLALASLALPVLNDIAAKDLTRTAFFQSDLILLLLGSTALSGLLGGMYPALLLSAYKSVDVLKGPAHTRKSGAIIRKSLVVTQFAISISLIAGTLIVYQQLDFMQNRDLGFDKEHILVVDAREVPRNQLMEQAQTLLDQFEVQATVQNANFSQSIPGRGAGRNLFNAEGLSEDDTRSGAMVAVGYDYFENYGISVIAGRPFSRDFPSDEQDGMIVNEALIEYVGWTSPEEAIGKGIGMGNSRQVVGVVQNYHHSSLKNEIEPTMYSYSPRAIGYVSLRVAGADASVAMEAAEEVWNTFYPELAFDAFFLDDDFNRQYQDEERLMSVFSIFSVLAIIIACLGLFGLASFTATQRTKEIGVRKVLGASVPSIVRLLSTEFALLVLIGLIIAVPATLYGMQKWLDAFAFHSEISVWIFVAAGGSGLAIALLTVGVQASRAASANPVESLRYE